MLIPVAAAAQDDSRDQAIEVELGARSFFTDNFYYRPTGERSVSGVIVSPGASARRISGLVSLSADANAEFATFSSDSDDAYTDFSLAGNAAIRLPIRQILRLTAGGSRGHDPFGTERTEGQAVADQELDIWRQGQAGVSLTADDPAAHRFGYILDYGVARREYRTNRSSTRFLDRDVQTVAATMFLNLSPKVSLLANAKWFDLQYETVGAVDRSGNATTLLAGVRWEATAKTSGDLRFGSTRFEPDAQDQDRVDTSSWQAGVTWLPTLRTTVRLHANRDKRPTYRFDASVIDDRTLGAAWFQELSYRLESVLRYTALKRDFVGSPEQHDIEHLRLRFNYTLDQDFLVYIDALWHSRDAVDPSQNFDRINGSVGLQVNFN